MFDYFDLWFEATDVVRIGRRLSGMSLTRVKPNRYNICVSIEAIKITLADARYLQQDGDHYFVTFSSHNTGAQLPDPKLLTFHAACARVARLSGAAQAIDELEEDDEDLAF